MKIQTHDTKSFFRYVLPAILSFSLSGVYSIVDGYFIGNRLGDIGLSAVTIAHPIVALLQAIGTGFGMGGAIYFSIYKAKGEDSRARLFIAISNWLMLVFSVILTAMIFFWNSPALRLLGAGGELFIRAKEYIGVISLGTTFQIFGTGLVPFIRNLGGSAYVMVSMIAGFITNIIADYLFVWVWEQGMAGAAIAVYACIAYTISVISLALQGVGDGSQPLISKYYGAGSFRQLRSIRNLAYGFSLLRSAAVAPLCICGEIKLGFCLVVRS